MLMSTTIFSSIHLKTSSFFPTPLPTKHQNLTFSFKPNSPIAPIKWHHINSCAAGQEIDMERTKEGLYTAKPKKVVILWDLDNKPPRGPPYEAAMCLKKVAQSFGEVVDMSAYANRHAFIHLPQWVVEQRRERRHLDVLERKGAVTPSEPYICSVCGRKCKTNLDLKKHFKQLHERERQKKLSRMRSLKGKKRQKFKERHVDGNYKYIEAARSLITPKVGYGLAAELRRAGVFVKTVADKPQAADWALKKQMQHSMTRGIDWLFLVSDDSDFCDMLRRAKEANLGTVVVGDMDRALGRHADLWIPWNGVENGEIKEKDLVLKLERRRESWGRSNARFSVSEFDGGISGEGTSVGTLMDDIVEKLELSSMRISAFSEGEEDEDEDVEELDEEDWLRARLDQPGDDKYDTEDSLLDSEDEEGDYLLDSDDEDPGQMV
ncbi:uncharacterized protein LOC107812281 isoform X1 [Nicotiana tabacum]|uniref:Uncharacterized protein LOC107812281 isoform X1 n=14 Tax=Nicotiana tabacum TaxID=4097 RepID=A0AC58UNZ7_TOBAC|nr:PREDICTED: uncharacterized protein LOC107812283 [Nicotiana tabacum]